MPGYDDGSIKEVDSVVDQIHNDDDNFAGRNPNDGEESIAPAEAGKAGGPSTAVIAGSAAAAVVVAAAVIGVAVYFATKKHHPRGTMTEWGDWSACSASCGGGNHTRHRNCTVPDAEACSGNSTKQEAPCNTFSCAPPPDKWGKWSGWSKCSVSCSAYGAKETRTRKCLNKQCRGSTQDTRACANKPCPAVYGKWGAWGKCSASCGGGSRYRQKTCTKHCLKQPATVNGTESCGTITCVAIYSAWTAWTKCTYSCGSGTQSRTRNCTGGPCEQPTQTKKQSCNTFSCKPLWNPWSAWTKCPVTCGGGNQTRYRTCKRGYCSSARQDDQYACNTKKCPVVWSGWTEWSVCDKSCDGGHRTRSRTCKSGNNCPPNKAGQKGTCNTKYCQAVWSSWITRDGGGVWSDCTHSCGAHGWKYKQRTCTWHNKIKCRKEDASAKAKCNRKECPGIWGSWSKYSSCSKSCGSGKRTATRKCVKGHCKGKKSKDYSCNTQACPKPLPDCGHKLLDIVFVVDSSGSIKNHFDFERMFVNRIAKSFTIDNNYTRIALINFNQHPHLILSFTEKQNKAIVLTKIKNLAHMNGTTETGEAFKMVRTKLGPTTRKNVPRILILITDGNADNEKKLFKEADLLKKEDWYISPIGISLDKSGQMTPTAQRQLKYVSSSNQFSVPVAQDFQHLAYLVYQVGTQACKVDDTHGNKGT